MSGSEWAAVVAAQVCLVLLVVLVVVIVRLERAARDLRTAAADFRAEAEPALEELRAVVRRRRLRARPGRRHRHRRRAGERPGRRRVRPRVPHLHQPGGQGARGRHRHPPRRRSGSRVTSRRSPRSATSGGRPDVQARHVARRGVHPRGRHHRRGCAQGPPAARPLQANAVVDRVTTTVSGKASTVRDQVAAAQRGS